MVELTRRPTLLERLSRWWNDEPEKPLPSRWLAVLIPVLQIQGVLAVGFALSFGVSVFFTFVQDGRYPAEQPLWSAVGFFLTLALYLLGHALAERYGHERRSGIRETTWVMLLAWLLATSVTALLYLLEGVPSPGATGIGLGQRVVDAFYEALSGFTTTGTSILPSVEAFPRSFLFWRTLTHWYGGMGIAYLAVTWMRHLYADRAELVNAESESQAHVDFQSDRQVVESGRRFFGVYAGLTFSLILLLILSGWWFRQVPYTAWYDNVYDAVTFGFSTLGTGGFAVYNSSVGLPVGDQLGGLANPVSEWIIALFMFFAGINFGLWYAVLTGSFKKIWRSIEFRTYLSVVVFLTLAIGVILLWRDVYPSLEQVARYAFFNVATIVSTTGLANQDFTAWPSSAQGLLFIAYLLGGMVGSTAGGLKVVRYVVAARYIWRQLQSLIFGRSQRDFVVDGVRYDDHAAGLILSHMLLYFMVFMIGGVLLMVSSHFFLTAPQSLPEVDFTTAFTASIAHLGNIGPAAAVGHFNTGPTGNYSAFSLPAKGVLMLLMFIGRVGILTFMMLFITRRGERRLAAAVKKKTTATVEPE